MFAIVVSLCAIMLSMLPATRLDGATIVNSGSTNFMGWKILVRADGSATVSPGARSVSIPKPLAIEFLSAARNAEQQRVAGRPCMKSVSFGTHLNVLYHGWLSPDLSCPAASVAQQALARDVQSIIVIAGPPSGLHRIHVPIEPRRVPTSQPG